MATVAVDWDPVMHAVDGLLLAIARLEEGLGRVEHG